jgi:hypothetical protein
MKKITLLMFLCFLISGLSLFVHASGLIPMLPPIEWIEANNYKEYQNAIEGVEMSENFVPYERLAFLGEFRKFRGIEGDPSLSFYSYTLISPDGTELNLFFNTHPYAEYDMELELIGSIPYSFKSGKGYFDPESALTMLREYYNQDFIDKANGFCFGFEFALNTLGNELHICRSCLGNRQTGRNNTALPLHLRRTDTASIHSPSSSPTISCTSSSMSSS